jgi:hypothetical protein
MPTAPFAKRPFFPLRKSGLTGRSGRWATVRVPAFKESTAPQAHQRWAFWRSKSRRSFDFDRFCGCLLPAEERHRRTTEQRAIDLFANLVEGDLAQPESIAVQNGKRMNKREGDDLDPQQHHHRHRMMMGAMGRMPSASVPTWRGAWRAASQVSRGGGRDKEKRGRAVVQRYLQDSERFEAKVWTTMQALRSARWRSSNSPS